MANQPRIIICDDSTIQRSLIKKFFSKFEVEIIECSTGEECLTYLDLYEHEIDLCTLDIHMPEKSGLDVLREIKKANLNIPPILMITTENNKARVLEAIQLDCAGYICKPFSEEQLQSQAQAIIEDKQNKKLIKKNVY